MQARKRELFLARYPITTYFVVTFLVTIILGAIYQFTSNMFFTPQYAPTIAIIIICMLSKDWSVWEKRIWHGLKRQINISWLLVALLLPMAIILIATLIMTMWGIEFVPWQATTARYIMTIMVTILGCVFEEIGWRGYLLPKFEEKYSKFNSAIGVGLLWGVWHSKFSYGMLGFLLFVILMVFFSILMSWIYMKTNGNLWYMIIFHFGINIASVTLLQNREGVLFYGLAIIICLLICIPLVIRNKTAFFTKRPAISST